MLSPGGWLVIEDALITVGILEGPESYVEALTSFAQHRPALALTTLGRAIFPAIFGSSGWGALAPSGLLTYSNLVLT